MNIGNFILLSIIILFIASAIIFCLKGYEILQTKITNVKRDIAINLKFDDDNLSKKPLEIYDIKPVEKKIKVKKRKSKNINSKVMKKKRRSQFVMKSNINLNKRS